MSGAEISDFSEVVGLLQDAMGKDFNINDYQPYKDARMIITVQSFFESDDADRLTDEQYQKIAVAYAKEILAYWPSADRNQFLQAVENDSVEVIGRSDYDTHPLFGGANENFLNNVKRLEASGKMVGGFQLGNRMVGVIF